MVTKVSKCAICGVRPRHNGESYCAPCGGKVAAEYRRKENLRPVKFLIYRDNVVGLFRNGGGLLVPRLLKRDPEKLPKGKTINLDRYCPGFDRQQIRKMKRAILSVTQS